jgi:hypothetical protein
MGQHTDATIAANEQNAGEGHVVPAPWGYFIAHAPGWVEPILAWRIGDRDCNAVLPVTATGTYPSQSWVLRPDGRVVYHCIHYGSFVEPYETLEAWAKDNPCPEAERYAGEFMNAVG